jgi:hypothetical protein
MNYGTMLKKEQGRYCRYSVLVRNLLVFISIALGKANLSSVCTGQFFNDGSEYTTRTTPRCPEINDE